VTDTWAAPDRLRTRPAVVCRYPGRPRLQVRDETALSCWPPWSDGAATVSGAPASRDTRADGRCPARPPRRSRSRWTGEAGHVSALTTGCAAAAPGDPSRVDCGLAGTVMLRVRSPPPRRWADGLGPPVSTATRAAPGAPDGHGARRAACAPGRRRVDGDSLAVSCLHGHRRRAPAVTSSSTPRRRLRFVSGLLLSPGATLREGRHGAPRTGESRWPFAPAHRDDGGDACWREAGRSRSTTVNPTNPGGWAPGPKSAGARGLGRWSRTCRNAGVLPRRRRPSRVARVDGDRLAGEFHAARHRDPCPCSPRPGARSLQARDGMTVARARGAGRSRRRPARRQPSEPDRQRSPPSPRFSRRARRRLSLAWRTSGAMRPTGLARAPPPKLKRGSAAT